MREPFVQFPMAVRTAADFKIGDPVNVTADQGIRAGVVTKVARTRIHVRHPRNKKGDMVERPYPMSAVIVAETHTMRGWCTVTADGNFGGYWGQPVPHGRLPIVKDPCALSTKDANRG